MGGGDLREMTPTPKGWLLDPMRLRQLNAVAAMVSSFPYTPDTVSDWRSDLTGDCQGKSTWAHDALEAAGWPAEAMEWWARDLGAEARPELGERPGQRHGVLIVNIADAEGTVIPTVIDCRKDRPMRKVDLGYTDWCFVS